VKLYTYACGDGVWRTRCRRHMAKAGRLAPTFIEGAREGRADECYACYWERLGRWSDADVDAAGGATLEPAGTVAG